MPGTKYSLSERRLRETTMTRAEAIAWAEGWYEERRTWPGRRFRLEGTGAGNSRLVTREAADRSRRKYGGTISELIPTRAAYLEEFHGIKRLTPAIEMALKLPRCPKCGAAEGKPCTDKGGNRMPHKARYTADDLRAASADYDFCATCSVDAGAPCVDNGKPRPIHRGRQRAEKVTPALAKAAV